MHSRRSHARRPGPIALLAAGGAGLAVAGLLGGRRVARAARPAIERVRGTSAAPAPETWACACGQEYRVSGRGRHRIYWPEGAAESDPLLAPECVNCERPLPTA
jgi:putative intracellular protease/amidase